MSSLPNRTARDHRDGGENAPISAEFPHPSPPRDLAPKPAAREWIGHHEVEMPRLDQLVEERAPGSALRVFRFLNKMGRRARPDGAMRQGAYVRTSTIAKETGLAESTVRTVAIPWLVAHGWLAGQGLEIRGEDRVMFWCLWLLPDLAGAAIDIGHGFRYRCDDRAVAPAGPPRPRRAAKAAPAPSPISPGGAAGCAQPAAPNSSNEFKTEEKTLTLTRPCPGGDESKSPEPMPPAAGPRAPAPPEQCLAALATAPARFPSTVAQALWDLVDQGVPLPGPWAKVKMPARPEPDQPPAPTPRPAPATSRPASAAATTTEDLIRRIAEPCGPEAVAAKVKLLSRRVAEDLDDDHSANFYAKHLARAASGEIRIKPFLAAFLAARKSTTARRKGAIFTDKFRELTGGPP